MNIVSPQRGLAPLMAIGKLRLMVQLGIVLPLAGWGCLIVSAQVQGPDSPPASSQSTMSPRHAEPAQTSEASQPSDQALVRQPLEQGGKPSLAEVYQFVERVENLAPEMHRALKEYHRDVALLTRKYNRGFRFPGTPTIEAADEDMATDNPGFVEEMKDRAFTSRYFAAGQALDPDLRGDISRLKSLQAQVDDVTEQAWRVRVFGLDTISRNDDPHSIKWSESLTKRLRAAENAAERAKAYVDRALPVDLPLGQPITVATAFEGLHGKFLGIEFHSPLSNLELITYLGEDPATGLKVFLQQEFDHRVEKAFHMTLSSTRWVGVVTDPSRREYGHHLLLHAITRRYLNESIRDLYPSSEDAYWARLARSGTPQPTRDQIAAAVQLVRDNTTALRKAIDAFQSLSQTALEKNDRMQKNLKIDKRPIPEAVLVSLDTGHFRRLLFEARALAAKDPAFLAALEIISLAKDKADTDLKNVQNILCFFNGWPDWPDFASLPISRGEIDATQEGYQNAVYRLRETENEVEDIGFLTLPEGQGVFVIPPPRMTTPAIVLVKNLGTAGEHDGHLRIFEDIWTPGHAERKGDNTFNRVPEFLSVGKDGDHVVEWSFKTERYSGWNLWRIYEEVANK
jgi:hypothetical protein